MERQPLTELCREEGDSTGGARHSPPHPPHTEPFFAFKEVGMKKRSRISLMRLINLKVGAMFKETISQTWHRHYFTVKLRNWSTVNTWLLLKK